MLDAHLFEELPQAHVCQTVAAAELKPAADLTLCHFAASEAEHLLLSKVMDRPEELKLIAEIVDVEHKALAFW